MRDAYEWGLSDEDISLLVSAWEIKAKNLGGEGIKRWNQLMAEFDTMKSKYSKLQNVAWIKPDKNKELQRIGLTIERDYP